MIGHDRRRSRSRDRSPSTDRNNDDKQRCCIEDRERKGQYDKNSERNYASTLHPKTSSLRSKEKWHRGESPGTVFVSTDSTNHQEALVASTAVAEKKAARAVKLKAWKSKQQTTTKLNGDYDGKDDPLLKAQRIANALASGKLFEKEVDKDDLDPLDTFMNREILPELQAKEELERKQAENSNHEGKLPKYLQELVYDCAVDDDLPNLTVDIPSNKLKVVIGPGGEKIRNIERQSKCRIQHAKSAFEMNRGFGENLAELGKAAAAAVMTGERKMTTLHLFGNLESCEIAREMILEAVQNREQKSKQREREYERKKESKAMERRIQHLRHSRDYEALEIPLGASKAEIKAAFRKLALKWHPDKNTENREEAERKFQEVGRAYERLMSTDEHTVVEQIGF